MRGRTPLTVTAIAALLCVVPPAAWAGADGCPVTLPNGRAAPGREPAPDWFGNGSIWTFVPRDGVLRARPDQAAPTLRPDGSVYMKFQWFSARPVKRLKLKGRRVDGSAAGFRDVITTFDKPQTFWAHPVVFPALGCWKITVSGAGRRPLTLVTSVVNAT